MEFEQTKYSVYARPNKNNKVIKIFSTCFEQPQDTDILLKTGSGDEYVHVGYYQLLNTDGTHRYCIDNEAMRECTEEELEEERATFPKPQPTEEQKKIADLEETVMATDEAVASLYEMTITQDEVNNAQDEAIIGIYEMLGGE